MPQDDALSDSLPKMFRVRQYFDGRSLAAPGDAVRQELERIGLGERIQAGQSVAIAVGSRGIAKLAEIVAAAVRYVDAVGGKPFIVPAMGSHGGGTAEGQQEMLASLGVTPETVGCQVHASMETELLGNTVDGIPVHTDSVTLAADHLIVVNRVKPHTRFAGAYQSGLAKMLMIGLGKRTGASIYHRANQRISFDRLIKTAIPLILARRPLTVGLAIIENALDATFLVEAVEQADLLNREPQLLQMAQTLMPRLPFDRADLLIVDQIGKDISGTGMDTNIIGRKQSDKVAGPDEYPKIGHIYVRGLTERTHGNAAGIGLAELCHQNVREAIDYEATKVNSLTAGHITAAAVPAHFASDQSALEAALSQSGWDASPQLRWLWIRDTLHLGEVLCSEVYYPDAVQREDLEVLSQPESYTFDAAGNILTPAHCLAINSSAK